MLEFDDPSTEGILKVAIANRQLVTFKYFGAYYEREPIAIGTVSSKSNYDGGASIEMERSGVLITLPRGREDQNEEQVELPSDLADGVSTDVPEMWPMFILEHIEDLGVFDNVLISSSNEKIRRVLSKMKDIVCQVPLS